MLKYFSCTFCNYKCFSFMQSLKRFTERQHSSLCRCPVLAMAKASVCLSVCHTLLPKVTQAKITKPSLSSPRRTLLLGSVKVFYRFETDHSDRGGWMRGGTENLRFLTNKSPYLRDRAEIGPRLLWITDSMQIMTGIYWLCALERSK